jgi:hypothetical protein
MATLDRYFGTHTGTLKIYIGAFQIGTGSFEAFDDFHAEFTGSYVVLGQPGTLTIGIWLNDDNPGSSSGPCEITISGKTDDAATYRVNGPKLTLTTKLNDTPVDVYGSQGGTQIDGVSGHNIWIGQWS